jgi:hypothetical protein
VAGVQQQRLRLTRRSTRNGDQGQAGEQSQRRVAKYIAKYRSAGSGLGNGRGHGLGLSVRCDSDLGCGLLQVGNFGLVGCPDGNKRNAMAVPAFVDIRCETRGKSWISSEKASKKPVRHGWEQRIKLTSF